MMNGDCFSGDWGSFLGNFGVWGWIGLILNLIFSVGLIAGLILIVVWAVRRARVPTATGPHTTGQPTAKETLQTQYARGEITREQYEIRKQELASPATDEALLSK
jgi:putative membrane protein